MMNTIFRSPVCFGVIFAWIIVPAHSLSAQQARASGYKLDKKVKLGGTGGWDYLEVDPATHRLFISRATHVIVVDPEQGKILGDIPNTQGVHGIALADEFNKGFTTNGKTADSTAFDLPRYRLSATSRPTRIPTRSSTIRFRSGSSPSTEMLTPPLPSTSRQPKRLEQFRSVAGRSSERPTTAGIFLSISRTRARWSNSTPRL